LIQLDEIIREVSYVCVLLHTDINLRHSELVQQLRDHVQDTLLDHLISQGSGPTLANRRICDLLLLMPLLTHKKILAKEFWLGVKHGGRVTLHKLLSEMLEFLCAWNDVVPSR